MISPAAMQRYGLAADHGRVADPIGRAAHLGTDSTARRIAAEAGLTIETRTTGGPNGALGTDSTMVGVLVALAVLAMTVRPHPQRDCRRHAHTHRRRCQHPHTALARRCHRRRARTARRCTRRRRRTPRRARMEPRTPRLVGPHPGREPARPHRRPPPRRRRRGLVARRRSPRAIARAHSPELASPPADSGPSTPTIFQRLTFGKLTSCRRVVRRPSGRSHRRPPLATRPPDERPGHLASRRP